MVIYQSNALIEASYRLTTIEKKLILACITKIRHDQVITDEVMYSISAEEISKLGGISVDAGYKNLHEAANRLLDRVVSITYEPNGGKKHKTTLKTHWVQSITYVDKEARVNLRFSKDMLPYINQITKQFTHYNYSAIAKMGSIHGIRLYELLVQWKASGYREIDIDWLKKQFNLTEKYSSIRDLKKRVIDPAVEEINNHSDMWCKWEQRKTGRRVTHLIFTFGSKNELPKKLKSGLTKKEKKLAEFKKIMEKTGKPCHEEVAWKILPGETYGDCERRLIGLWEEEKKIKF